MRIARGKILVLETRTEEEQTRDQTRDQRTMVDEAEIRENEYQGVKHAEKNISGPVIQSLLVTVVAVKDTTKVSVLIFQAEQMLSQ